MRLSEEGRIMGKLETGQRISKQRREYKEKYATEWMDLYNQIALQKVIISDAGKGSRKANTAQKKITSIQKKLDKLQDKRDHFESRMRKDYDLAEDYGESAMEARSFGTDRDVNYEYTYDKSLRDVRLKDPPMKSTQDLNRKKGKAKGGYVKKYAKGSGVRKAR